MHNGAFFTPDELRFFSVAEDLDLEMPRFYVFLRENFLRARDFSLAKAAAQLHTRQTLLLDNKCIFLFMFE